MKKFLVVHPFLFGIFPILFVFSHNIGQMTFSQILVPGAIALCLTLLLLLLSGVIFRDIQKAGIIVSIFLLLFFFYGHVYDMIRPPYWQIGSFLLGKHRLLLFIWGILFICGAYFTIRTRRNLNNITNTLNIIAGLLVIISVINISAYELKTDISAQTNNINKNSETKKLGSIKADNLPDIYYIIMDGYTSSSNLKEFYDFDNNEFVDYLRKKDFYIATESRSNYAYTPLSLASSLNMEYINYLSDIVGAEAKDTRLLYELVKDNKVMKYLKSQGYKFINYSSGWGPTSYNRNADLNVMCGKLDEFLTTLVQTTMLRSIDKYFAGSDAKNRILCTFSKLSQVHRTEGRKFVFAHIFAPHPPFLFDANGDPVPDSEFKIDDQKRNLWKEKEKYVNYLIFANNKIKTVINEILSNSEVPSIIILQGDHGSCSTWPDSTKIMAELGKPTDKMLIERMRIFNAYYLPLGGNKVLYGSISPVNTFRQIFNYYFHTDYELLDDQSYYSSSKQQYKFTNVTDKVRFN